MLSDGAEFIILHGQKMEEHIYFAYNSIENTIWRVLDCNLDLRAFLGMFQGSLYRFKLAELYEL